LYQQKRYMTALQLHQAEVWKQCHRGCCLLSAYLKRIS